MDTVAPLPERSQHAAPRRDRLRQRNRWPQRHLSGRLIGLQGGLVPQAKRDTSQPARRLVVDQGLDPVGFTVPLRRDEFEIADSYDRLRPPWGSLWRRGGQQRTAERRYYEDRDHHPKPERSHATHLVPQL